MINDGNYIGAREDAATRTLESFRRGCKPLRGQPILRRNCDGESGETDRRSNSVYR